MKHLKRSKFQAPGPVQIQGPTQVLILNRNLKSKNVQRHYNQNPGWPTTPFNFYKNATVDKGFGRVVEVIKINCVIIDNNCVCVAPVYVDMMCG